MYQAARLPSRRLMTIDQAVRAREWPDGPTPARRLEVDLRTMRRDITFLREQLGAPIKYDPARKGYHDTELSDRLPCLHLAGGDLVPLDLAERLMRPLEGTPFESDLRRAIDKLGTMPPTGSPSASTRRPTCWPSCRRPGRFRPGIVLRFGNGGRLPASCGDGLPDGGPRRDDRAHVRSSGTGRD